MIKKLLIANRGEIARRIIRTAHSMGIETIAIASYSERNEAWVNEAVHFEIFPNDNVQDTWLNADEIVCIAIKHSADAIHPGYGFLSENAQFAKKIEDANLIFVGPTWKTIEQMGDKLNARVTATKAGIPVQAIHKGSIETLLSLKDTIEYPILIKATAGGGGKGMQRVDSKENYDQAIKQTAREALSYFGNDTIYVEPLVTNARHIEVQIFGDGNGNVIHLGERDCSLQRRHQKIIEEAPASILTHDQRTLVTQYAVSLAKQLNYRSAGTVEFLLDMNGKFHFLEMNTRIQVEHPITEAITNIDIVKLQLETAIGKVLSISQEQIQFKGYAIEARLYAEKAAQNFLPDAGVIHELAFPKYQWLRIDTAFDSAGFAHPNFDPMLAKIIVHGETRKETRQKILLVLKQTRLAGIENNVNFLKQLIETEAFEKNKFHTRFIESEFTYQQPNWQTEHKVAATLLLSQPKSDYNEYVWNAGYYRQIPTNFTLQFQNKTENCIINQHEQSTEIIIDKVPIKIQSHTTHNNSITIQINNNYHRFNHFTFNNSTWIFDEGKTFEVTQLLPISGKQLKQESNKKQQNTRAPMYGKILEIPVKPGVKVKNGQTILIIESMKMENHIKAVADALVKSILVKEGEQVTDGQLLVEFE